MSNREFTNLLKNGDYEFFDGNYVVSLSYAARWGYTHKRGKDADKIMDEINRRIMLDGDIGGKQFTKRQRDYML
jgi:hypothetical protein